MERLYAKARINPFTLWPALRAALGERVESITHARGQVIVRLAAGATGDDEARAAGIVSAHDPDALAPAQQAAEDLKARVLDIARGSEGVALDDLTAPQQRALLTVLLWKGGALDEHLAIRPLGDWVHA